MGCRCGYSLCTICNNKAVNEEDFCEHIVKFKASTFNGLPVWEDNRDVEFFEDSFVCQGADKKAKILEKVASRHNNIPIIRKSVNQYDNELMLKIAKEQNQRTYTGRINSLAEQLKNIPWT